uniref:Probable WRKY transcription factor 27 n=1 Tax=Cicer arietinum TaxID=3827 RepID=A0A1S3DW92_CICAR|nr:probable WRKY transcription factor 27 [Cicer arietinum]
MDNDGWDLSAIVRSCKATTFTNPTTVFETPTPNTSTNNARSPLKPTDFIELEKLTTIINPNTTISTPTSTSTSTSTSASAANILKPTFTIGTPAFTYTSVHNTNQNSTFYDVSTLGIQQEMQLNPQTDLFTRVYIPTKVNCIKVTSAHFDLAYNHPSLQQQSQRELNQLPIQVTQINSVVLPNTRPQRKKYRSKYRKNQQMNLVCHVNTEKLLEDPWAWRKYGQKPIKGSPYPS